ncbi:MAG TPA: zinc-finger domain-containing protein [Burkholderiaceae bacterium]|nr:zinc-finger domain-containing protein [Pseudomonadota bacterium]MDQ7973987.1 zinc-finger domain-containing protein [Rhodocyclaceae bacterium]MDQ8017297.1 zinc-finger domain-containing protein [Pseudomonadota bacterium]HZF86691.1 zinc-finger domain-containing protein [Burkholderiaceae bacterium]
MSTHNSTLVDQVQSADRRSLVELAAKDLNHQGGIFCPSPKADMKLWNSHPKVYLDVARTGEAKCPYCGTVYRLKAGEHFGHHH